MGPSDFFKELDDRTTEQVEREKFDTIVSLLAEIRDLLKKPETTPPKNDTIKP
jgi:hypothetical protein